MTDVAVTKTESAQQGQTGAKLAREFGFFAVLVFSISSMGLLTTGQVLFSDIIGRWSVNDLVFVLAIGVIPLLFHAYTFSMIGSVIPRVGADYILTSRVLGKPLGFVTSWSMMVTTAFLAGTFITSISQRVFPTYFLTIGITRKSSAMLVTASQLVTSDTIVTIATICLVLAFLSLLMPPRFTLRTMQVGFFLLLAAWAIILITLVAAPGFSFQAGWDSMLGSGSYLDHLIQAKTRGMDAMSALTPLPAAVALIGCWLYFGSFSTMYLAGEAKNPEKTLLPVSLLTLLAAAGLFIGVSLLLTRIIPLEWLVAESFLSQTPAFEGTAVPWLLFYTAVIAPSPMFSTLVFATWIYVCINLAQAFLFYSSRIVLSWTEDRMAPELLGFIHPKSKSPIMAVLVVCIIAEIGVVGSAASYAIWDQMNYIFYILCIQVFPVLAVILLPFKKRDWFENAPKIARYKIGPLPVISLAGAITLLYLLAVIAAGIFYPDLIHLNIYGLFVCIMTTWLGLIWFYLRRSYLKNRDTSSEMLPAD